MDQIISNFATDKQTTDDLQILGKYSTGSLYTLFRRTKTKGGELLLESYLLHPLKERFAIKKRQERIQSLVGKALVFPVDSSDFKEFELFIKSYPSTSPMSLFAQFAKRQTQAWIGAQEESTYIKQQVENSIKTLLLLKTWFKSTLENIESPYIEEMCKLFSNFWEIVPLMQHSPITSTLKSQFNHERFLRTDQHANILQLIDVCHELDLYIAVAEVAYEKNFTFPTLSDENKVSLELIEAFHPTIPNAIGNTLSLHSQENLLFLTGANMAGKSTWMKTIGICLYLGQLGFPVPASEMKFCIFDGIFTSINLPDDIQKGYSHFYAEVMRVKSIAEEIASGKRLLVIFDELFKGTNVKDAYDATLQITEHLTEYANCLFVISTHIVEVGMALKEKSSKIQYRYMPTIMAGSSATYTYKSKDGISDDRHGMMIIREEGILELFENKNTI